MRTNREHLTWYEWQQAAGVPASLRAISMRYLLVVHALDSLRDAGALSTYRCWSDAVTRAKNAYAVVYNAAERSFRDAWERGEDPSEYRNQK